MPPDVQKVLGLHEGDMLRLEMRGSELVVKRYAPLDMSEPSEKEFRALIDSAMTEWHDEKDDELMAPWNSHGTV